MPHFDAPIAQQIWDMKYRYKNPMGEPIDQTVEDTWRRIAATLTRPEADGGHAEVFYEALEDFKFLPAGRIISGAGTGRAVTMFNCFVMGTIPDSMNGIFEMLKEAALTMQQGGGIGYDFSTIRPKGSLVKKLGAEASGPLTFMDCWDSMCRTVMSAGSRRGAMMATMRCDHPDIEEFILAKQDTARLRMFNLSVLVTDAFMEAVSDDKRWPLVHNQPPKNLPEEHVGSMLDDDGNVLFLHRTVRARDLWEKIMRSTYDAAEPGVIFIDRINNDNNLSYCETISSTNPCGEQPLPPYGACLLGSINLARLVDNPFTDYADIDQSRLTQLVRTAVRMMDNVIDVSNFPLAQQAQEAMKKRRIGLGVTGLADALAMLRLHYGSNEARKQAADWMRWIDHAAYEASVDLAKEKGAFPDFDADGFLRNDTHASRLPLEIMDSIRTHGIRNALLTSIAPTGTISLYGGNVSSGIEPIFAWSYKRKVLKEDGTHFEEVVEDYAVAKYREFWEGNMVGDKFVPEEHLPDYFVNAQDLSPTDHIYMQSALQPYVDSSISKTINLPENIPFEEFKDVYRLAYQSGCKGCTTYRPNDITGSILSVEPKSGPEEPSPAAETAHTVWSADLPTRPEELQGSTYKIKVGDRKAVYLTVNDMIESDGTVRPFEIFMRSSDPTHDEWMVALARMVSAIMRRPHDASFVGPELMHISSAVSGGFQRGYGYQPSLVAAIGAKIKEHTDRIGGSSVTSEVFAALDIDDEIPDFNKPQPTAICQECGSYNTKFESGCLTCLQCGHSKCG